MSVPSLTINYTNCINQTLDETQEMPGDLVKASFKKSDDPVKVRWTHLNQEKRYPLSNANLSTEICRLEFNVPQDLEAPIYLYYTMTNFYQNHRKYVKSFFDKQLKGDVVSYGDIAASDCSPLSVDDQTKKAYYPCGLIANSVFNDTIENPVKLTSGDHRDNVTYEMSETNIAWESDTKLYGPYPTQDDPEYKKIQPPSFWRKQWPDGYTKEQPPPDLSKDEHLMVWMRTAGLPSFSKLYMSNKTHGMENGTYMIDIWDSAYSSSVFGRFSTSLEVTNMICRLPLVALRWNKEHLHHLVVQLARRPEPLPGHPLLNGRRSVSDTRCRVCRPAPVFPAEARRSHVPELGRGR